MYNQMEQIKKSRRQRSDKGVIRGKQLNTVQPEKNYKLNLEVYGNNYKLVNVTDVKKLFEKNDIEYMDDDIQYIIMNPYILRRLCLVIKGSNKYFTQKTVRERYLNNPNFKINPITL